MSLLEENDTSLTREDAINQIIASIASEELSLSHIINAEGEKLQYILGTLSGATGPSATIEEVLEVNRSISEVLEGVVENQTALRNKLKNVLSSAVLTGPTGPTGPAGASPAEIYGIQVEMLNGANTSVDNNATILFDNVISQVGTAISYDKVTGQFTISENGNYMVTWWVSIDGTSSTIGAVLTLIVNGTPHTRAAAPPVTGQIAGSAMVTVTNTPATLSVANTSGDPITLENINWQANIVIMAVATS